MVISWWRLLKEREPRPLCWQAPQPSYEAPLCHCGNHKAWISDPLSRGGGKEDLAQSKDIGSQASHYRNGTGKKMFQMMEVNKGPSQNFTKCSPWSQHCPATSGSASSLDERFKPTPVLTSPNPPKSPPTNTLNCSFKQDPVFLDKLLKRHLFTAIYPYFSGPIK